MPSILFLPMQTEVEVNENAKVLAAAIRNKIDIRYGCASCRCGTCGVKVDSSQATLLAMKDDEKNLLASMNLPTDNSVRLACRTKIQAGRLIVDLKFQNEYSPDDAI